MGRQIQIHLFETDSNDFVHYLRETEQVQIIAREGTSAEVEPIPSPESSKDIMILWRKDLLPTLRREPNNYRPGSFTVDIGLPVLEFSPSREADCFGYPTLLQGRIYGFFENPSEKLLAFYERIAGWIRRNFERNPVDTLQGYIGPNALKWFKGGGVLLPMVAPTTDESFSSWLRELERYR